MSEKDYPDLKLICFDLGICEECGLTIGIWDQECKCKCHEKMVE